MRNMRSKQRAPGQKAAGGKKRSSRLLTIVLLLVLAAGVCLLCYPAFSDYWNSLHQSRAIASYQEAVGDLDAQRYDELLAQAQAYNAALPHDDGRFRPSADEQAAYNAALDVSGTGIMGYIEIPKINVSLPIYHGTDAAVLQVAIGHIEGSSLPVGGAGTHCVLSGHRGLPSAKLFTDLDQLVEGDTFALHVLNETLTYEVDQILVVEPADVSALAIEEGKDYCTLVTCTPYGVNSHRLLVRGHRVENTDVLSVASDADWLAPLWIAPFVAIPVLLVVLLVEWIRMRRNRER